MLIIASSLFSNDGYFSTTKIVYSQSDPGQVNSNITNSVNIQNIPLEADVSPNTPKADESGL
jgi:hypothetical protein